VAAAAAGAAGGAGMCSLGDLLWIQSVLETRLSGLTCVN